MSQLRDTEAEEILLIRDPYERAKRESENGIRQFRLAQKLTAAFIAEPTAKPLRLSTILDLHKVALEGIHPFAGSFRNSTVTIGNSKHIPPRWSEVAEYMTEMVAFINENWEVHSATYLAAYAMWRLNWIHPFADGNGRTSRIISYLILSMKMLSILPGRPSIPDQIAQDRSPYYQELDNADEAYKRDGAIRIAGMEALIETMLAAQLAHAIAEAGL